MFMALCRICNQGCAIDLENMKLSAQCDSIAFPHQDMFFEYSVLSGSQLCMRMYPCDMHQCLLYPDLGSRK